MKTNKYSNFSKTFKLTTDASEHAVGAVLTQEKENMDMPIAYYSKAMNDCELRYNKEEKECLAVLSAVGHFRPYLYGRHFILACDHEPVHWMTYVENPGTRLIKWRLKLKDYEYTFEYKKGKLNTGVEALSENPTNSIKSPKSSELENSEESDSPEEDNKLEHPETLARVLKIHDRSTPVKVLPITRGQPFVPVIEKKSDHAA